MTNKFFRLGILSSLLFLLACKSGPSGESYVLKMRLKEGDSFNQNMKTKMNTKVSGLEMKMDMDMGITFLVIENKKEEKKLRLTYNKMNMKMDMANMDMDSLMNKNQNKMAGKSVELTLSPDNVITNVSGFDSLMADKMYDPATRQLMEKSFSKDQLNSTFGMMFSMYPTKPVKVGETWKSKTKFNMMNIDMNINLKYKLLSVKDGIAEINVEGKIDGDGKMDQAGMDLKLAMKGTQKGKMRIRLSDGYLKTGFYDMDMTSDIEVLGQKIPISVKGNIEISGE